MALSIDQVLERIGGFGWYQMRLTMIMALIEGINMVYQILIIVFIAAEPPWHCVANATNCTQPGSFRPGNDYFHHRCDIPRDQWKFGNEYTSVVTEFDLVCDRSYLASLSSAMIFGGWFIGALIGGTIADKFGRKTIVIISAFMISLWGFLIAFPKVLWFYMLARLFVGISRGCAGGSMFILLTEYVSVKNRHKPGTIMWFSWPIACGFLAVFAYACRDWRTLSIVLGAQGLPVFLTWWFIPESARYLVLKGRLGDCEKVLRKIAHVNKKEYPNEPLKDPTEGGKNQLRLGDFRDLFRSMSYTHKTLISWVTWIANAILLYGISLGVPDLGGDMYVTFFVLGLTDVVGTFLSIWIMGRFGRKKATAIPLCVAFICALATVLLQMYDVNESSGFYAGRIIMVFIARVCVAISINSIYVFSAELFPTVMRNIALGSGTAVARIGAFSAPFIAQANRIHVVLPYGIMGAIALVAGTLCMTLPETMGQPTAETVEDDLDDRDEKKYQFEEKNPSEALDEDDASLAVA